MPQHLVVQDSDTHNSQRVPRFSPRGRTMDGAAPGAVDPVTTLDR